MKVRKLFGCAILLALVTIWSSQATSAAEFSPGQYRTYVGCSAGYDAQPGELCDRGSQPGAFFESTGGSVQYEICVYYPGDLRRKPECLDHQSAEGGSLYENTLGKLTWPGNYYVTWSIAGVEIGSWAFDVQEIAVPPGSSEVLLACSHSADSNLIRFAPRPRVCTQFKHDRIDHAHEIWMSKLHWRDWGSRHAVGLGRWKNCGKEGCRSGPVKLVAMNPELACGYRSYTRLMIFIRGSKGSRSYSMTALNC